MSRREVELQVNIDYTNWRGKRRTRTIVPVEINFNWNQYHAERQWLLTAIDVEDGIRKTFAIQNIHRWSPVTYKGDS